MDAYIFRAALYCKSCGESLRADLRAACRAPEDETNEVTYDSGDYPKGPYAKGGGEADTPQHCDHCSVFLENPLTSDGYDYVKEAVREHDATGRGNDDVIAEWRSFYDIANPSDDDDSNA